MFTFLQKSSYNSDTVIYYMIQPFLRQCIQEFNLTDFNYRENYARIFRASIIATRGPKISM